MSWFMFAVRAPYAMRRKTLAYVAIPAIALGIVLANAFFGHLLLGSSYGPLINKYSIYVHLQPEWDSYPGNILYDVTNVWSPGISRAAMHDWPLSDGYNGTSGSNGTAYGRNAYTGHDPDDISSLAIYNPNKLQYQNSKPYVVLRHEFSDCATAWGPIPYRYAVDSLRSWIEIAQGIQVAGGPHVDAVYEAAAAGDPYVWIFPNIPASIPGGIVPHDGADHADYYVQFVPVCFSNPDSAVTYDYAISTNDPDVGFDAYFAKPAPDARGSEIPGYLPYDAPGCRVKSHSSFAGTCAGVEPGSGLLVVMPDDLNLSLTRVKIGLYERAAGGAPGIP